MFTVTEVARRIRVSESIVYSLIESGRLACHRIGLGRGTIRVTESDLQEYLDSCHSGTAETRATPEKRRRRKLKHVRL